ncbi:hypothetical protein C8R47DRAFT_1022495 [Mycena vitilis]|nr:hypothetical protein C8R47DRAFT_1022495 [Mycena vitilis]
MATGPQAFALNFPDFVRVAGETIAGTVSLHLALAQEHRIEHLQIRLTGSISTYVVHAQGYLIQTQPHTNEWGLLDSVLSLWSPGSASPEGGSGILSIPFQFQLPENLPPSFHCNASPHGGEISYCLEVVGNRHSSFRANRRLQQLVWIVPAATQSQLLVKESLRQGLVESWRDIKHEQRLRRGIWGGYSRAWATLSIPNLRSFPIATPVPYSFHVVTETKTVDRSDRPEDKHGKPLFPVPPTEAAMPTRVLRRRTTIRVSGRSRDSEEFFALRRFNNQGSSVHVDEPVWIPKDRKDENKGRGVWRRAVRFESTLTLAFTPTFSTETIDWVVRPSSSLYPLGFDSTQYALQFGVAFPGLGNDLKLEVPISIGPGLASLPPLGAAGASSLGYAEILPVGHLLDLPWYVLATPKHHC